MCEQALGTCDLCFSRAQFMELHQQTHIKLPSPHSSPLPCPVLTATFSQPPQFKLDPRLARLLGLHTQSRSAIVQALWQYVKTNRLQDSHDKEYINGDKYFQQVTAEPHRDGNPQGQVKGIRVLAAGVRSRSRFIPWIVW